MKSLRLVLLACVLGAPAAHAQELPAAARTPESAAGAMQGARELLESYIHRSRTFDASLADLYADHARIETVRRYPDGQFRRLTIEAPRYKAMIRQLMPAAQARRDTNRYSQPRYTAQGDKIRISMTRYSELKNYESPLELVVGRVPNGTWKILEERSETRP